MQLFGSFFWLVGSGCLGVFKGRCRVSWKWRTPTKQKVVARPTCEGMVNNIFEYFYHAQNQVSENSRGLCSHFCLYFYDFHLMCMCNSINVSPCTEVDYMRAEFASGGLLCSWRTEILLPLCVWWVFSSPEHSLPQPNVYYLVCFPTS